MGNATNVHTMTLDGGTIILDFINSGYDRRPGMITERLGNYEDLLTLSRRLKLFEAGQLDRLQDQAATHPREADVALRRTREARKLMYQFFSARVNGQTIAIEQETLSHINTLISQALSCRQLVIREQLPFFTDRFDPTALLSPLWKLVLEAHDLLAKGRTASIRQCCGCAWLFYDRSKSQRKKWCSMASCGNVQKTRRYYAHAKKR